ncbi:UNVERIFIED_CONTAM: Retrovirus-related Pol polyprotein from transposon TNT 1-94 [Sesamum radiatum]|uniref:Retrovirus-related Pol polyprotein from transposon TNT 1-94 n=1 Tax=Sesamum radiatum TaxID=300843 RepID=A0AAW2W0G1_SESRA
MAEPISVAIPIAPKVNLIGLPGKFSGQFFKRWQQQMKIWLTMKGLLTVIQVTRSEPTDTNPRSAEIEQWTEKDQIGRGAILSTLSDTLFDVYCSDSYTAKSLWDELDRKYNTEEQGLKKYSVFKFMRYQMVEDRFVAEQTHKIINLEHALADTEMKLSGKFLVGHWAKLCPSKKAKTGQAAVNMVVGGASTSGATEGYVSVQPELLTIYEPCDWWIDTGANVHKSKILGIEINTIVEFRDAVFIEDIFPMKTGIPSSVSLDDLLASTSIPEYVEKMTNVGVNPNSTSLTHEESDEPRRSKRARVVKNFGSDFVTYNIEDEPVTFKDVMASSKVKQRKEAVKTRLTIIRVLIALALVYSLPIHQMDVKTAFLCGELEEEIHMDQPEGFVAHDISFSVSKLARYTSCPNKTHWGALDRVLRYLKGTVSLAIHYGRFPTVFEEYSDASWIAKNSGSNGCSGYIFTIGGSAVS